MIISEFRSQIRGWQVIAICNHLTKLYGVMHVSPWDIVEAIMKADIDVVCLEDDDPSIKRLIAKAQEETK